MNLLKPYGLQPKHIEYIKTNNLTSFHPGRIINHHKDGYIVMGEEGPTKAVPTGQMLYNSESQEDLPCVGDWVLLIGEGELQVIHSIMPRYGVLVRKSVHHQASRQLIASNLDTAFIVHALDYPLNLNRLERYNTICQSGNISSVIILNKSDLVSEESLSKIKKKISKRIKNVKILSANTLNDSGTRLLDESLFPGKTYCLLGPSGVGKSSLVNCLMGNPQLKTGSISISTSKGKHTTTARSLITLDNGAILIDTPGLREVGVTDMQEAIEDSFGIIQTLASQCHFSNCTHSNEPFCAIRSALDSGEIDHEMYLNYRKLMKETKRFSQSLAEKRAKDKQLGKMYKSIMKITKRRKGK